VTKEFQGGVVAVDDVSLTIGSGEFMVLVGPSGCGKSTLLRLIAGLETVTEGSIALGGRDITGLPARERDIAMVFQNYALYPHMDVRRNLGYGLKLRGLGRKEVQRRVERIARLLELEEQLKRRPRQLSGGQRQRVAMGRAIVREPEAFLMDEPLSNLDAKIRVSMRAELTRLHNRLGVTTVYVTHDQVEAMTLGDRSAVLRDGRIQQVDTPQALYREPANLFVAAFIGSPSMNLARAELEGDAVLFAGFRIPLERGRCPAGGGLGTVILGIRPEDFEDAELSTPGLPTIEVTVEVLEDLGAESLAFFTIDAERLAADELGVAAEAADSTVLVAEDRRALFCAKIDSRSRAQVGGRLLLTVDPARFGFFDLYTGKRLRPARALELARAE
jgi:multiple sugar transport system ATP-binding protein